MDKAKTAPSHSPADSEKGSATGSKTDLDQRPTHWQSYWNVKQVAARAAEYGIKPKTQPCPECGGLEWLRDPTLVSNEYPMGRFINCPSCTAPQRRKWLARNCGLEGKLLSVTCDAWKRGEWPDLEPAEREERIAQRDTAWKFINRAIKHKKGLLTFWGGYGSGKTHALTIVANECRDQMVESYYAPLATILDHLRSLYGRRADSSEYWQRLLDVPVLALDEVTRFNATDWAREKLFVLVDTRYRRRASHLTLFATNDDPRKGLPAVDPLGYLFSRMREGAVLELQGDMRPAVGQHDQWWLNA